MLTSSPPALELRAVSKRFGAVQALEDVSVSLVAGRITGLCGENGAGKSTLSAIASGLLRPDAGAVLVDGQQVEFSSPRDAQQAGVRLVPQELVLCPNLTVAENVSLGELPRRGALLNRRQMRDVAAERLRRLGHWVDVAALAGDLSVVDQACVQIARALAPGASVLIVDEPTAPMSNSEAERFMRMIRALADAGMAIVYVSHRLDEVLQLADDIVVLRDGRLVLSCLREGLDRSSLVRSMVGDRDLSVTARGDAPERVPSLRVRGLAAPGLSDVDFDMHVGEILAVYGIAGSGREELGGATVGARARVAGRVTVGPDDIEIATLRDAIAAGVGYVPAERRSEGLILDMSVRDNLTLPMLDRLARFGVIRRNDERAMAKEWVGKLAIATPTVDQKVGVLSGGSQQKVLLGRWLAAGSQTLVLEEPTRGVDVATKAEIYRLLRSIAAGAGSVLVVSSDLEEVTTVADRVIVLHKGRIAGEFTDLDEATIAETALMEAVTDEKVAMGREGARP